MVVIARVLLSYTIQQTIYVALNHAYDNSIGAEYLQLCRYKGMLNLLLLLAQSINVFLVPTLMLATVYRKYTYRIVHGLLYSIQLVTAKWGMYVNSNIACTVIIIIGCNIICFIRCIEFLHKSINFYMWLMTSSKFENNFLWLQYTLSLELLVLVLDQAMIHGNTVCNSRFSPQQKGKKTAYSSLFDK